MNPLCIEGGSIALWIANGKYKVKYGFEIIDLFDKVFLGKDLIYTFELGVIVGMAAHKHADNILLRRTHVAAVT